MALPLPDTVLRRIAVLRHILITVDPAHRCQLPGISKRASKSSRMAPANVVRHDKPGETHQHRDLLSISFPPTRAFNYTYLKIHKRDIIQ